MVEAIAKDVWRHSFASWRKEKGALCNFDDNPNISALDNLEAVPRQIWAAFSHPTFQSNKLLKSGHHHSDKHFRASITIETTRHGSIMPFIPTDLGSYIKSDLFETVFSRTETQSSQPFPELDSSLPNHPEESRTQPTNKKVGPAFTPKDDDHGQDSAEDDDGNSTETNSPVTKRSRGRPRGRRARYQGTPRHSLRLEKLKSHPEIRLQSTAASRSKPVSRRGRGRPRLNKQQHSRPAGTSSKEWEVEKIMDSSIDPDSYEHFYKVKWKGFPATENTWEPKMNLTHCHEAIVAFEADKKRRG